jgi:hypothetical protein
VLRWDGNESHEVNDKVRRFSDREARMVEALLGPALPWACAMAVCPLPFSHDYAVWVRQTLQSEFEALIPSSTIPLDRLQALTTWRTTSGGLTMDFRLRWHLWWEVLAKRWSPLHLF